MRGHRPTAKTCRSSTKPVKAAGCGSVSDGVARYLVSEPFKKLAPSSQAMRRAIPERFRKKHGEKRLAMLRADQLAQSIAKLAPYAQRNWLKTLPGMMQFLIVEKLIEVDLTKSVAAA